MIARPLASLALALALALWLAGPACPPPAWSQSPGLTDPVQAPEVDAPTTMEDVEGGRGLYLTDLLWGLLRMEATSQRLTAEQRAKILPMLSRIVTGADLVRNFRGRVEKVLSTEQRSYILQLAAGGRLAEDPEDLPPASPGEDPLVTHILQILQAKAR